MTALGTLSDRRRPPGPAGSSTSDAPTSTAAATNTGTRNTSRQWMAVRTPPATNPSAKPLAPVAPKITRARVRRGPAKAVVMIDRAAGAVNAAEIPVISRDVISNAGLVATAPSPEATVKTVRDARNMRRRPYVSAAWPPSRRNPA